MKTQISIITALFLNYPKMLRIWNVNEFVVLPDECVGFKVSSPTYKGNVIISWQDNAFYSVHFRDMELKILGISNAEKVLDAVKDYVENGEVWVKVNADSLIPQHGSLRRETSRSARPLPRLRVGPSLLTAEGAVFLSRNCRCCSQEKLIMHLL